MIAEAQDLRSHGEHEAACKLLMRLIAGGYELVGLYALLGDSQACLDQWEEATASFERGVQIAPHSANASSGLFHCLLDRVLPLEAMEEVLRYLRADGNPERYEEVIHNMAEPEGVAEIERWLLTHRPEQHEETLRRFREYLDEIQRLL